MNIRDLKIKHPSWVAKTIGELIDTFKKEDFEIFYNGNEYIITLELKDLTLKDKKYYPTIRKRIEGQSYEDEMKSLIYFNSYEDLICNFCFEDGKKLLDKILNEPYIN